MANKHVFRFEVKGGNGSSALEFSGGPDKDDPSEWKYFTGDEITFASPSGPFILELMLTHSPTGGVIQHEKAVTPFADNQSKFESTEKPQGSGLWTAGPVTVRTPQEAGIPPSGDPSGFVARYRYAVAVGIEGGLILDTTQFGEWDHC